MIGRMLFKVRCYFLLEDSGSQLFFLKKITNKLIVALTSVKCCISFKLLITFTIKMCFFYYTGILPFETTISSATL